MMLPQGDPMPRRLLVVGAMLVVTLRTSAASPATTRAATRPATTTASTKEDKIMAQLEAELSRVLPKEVVEAKQDPTDEQRVIMEMLLFIQGGGGTEAERTENAEKNRKKGRDQIAAV